jgi:hypothetical protein
MSDPVNTPIKKTAFAKMENSSKENILRLINIDTTIEIISDTPRRNIVNLKSIVGLPKKRSIFLF